MVASSEPREYWTLDPKCTSQFWLRGGSVQAYEFFHEHWYNTHIWDVKGANFASSQTLECEIIHGINRRTAGQPFAWLITSQIFLIDVCTIRKQQVYDFGIVILIHRYDMQWRLEAKIGRIDIEATFE